MHDSLKNIFISCPYTTEFSQFEQENFLSAPAAGYPRYVIGLINQHRKIESDLEQEVRNFERNVLLEQKNKIENILLNQDQEKLNNAILNWEQTEAEYWADTLGKIAAIEILTDGKTSYDTMMKMVKLPTDLYIKSTQICVKLATAVKETTIQAETETGMFSESAVPEAVVPTTPKKLFLKKTK